MAFRCAAAASGILYKDRKNHLPNRKNRGECIFFGQKYLFSENMSIFAVPNREVFGCGKHLERCRSGRSGRTRNAVYGQPYPGFESLSLRNRGQRCKRKFTPFCFYRKNGLARDERKNKKGVRRSRLCPNVARRPPAGKGKTQLIPFVRKKSFFVRISCQGFRF